MESTPADTQSKICQTKGSSAEILRVVTRRRVRDRLVNYCSVGS